MNLFAGILKAYRVIAAIIVAALVAITTYLVDETADLSEVLDKYKTERQEFLDDTAPEAE